MKNNNDNNCKKKKKKCKSDKKAVCRHIRHTNACKTHGTQNRNNKKKLTLLQDDCNNNNNHNENIGCGLNENSEKKLKQSE